MALLALKNAGRCEFALTEALFDRDFPGHHRRQIRTVGVSFDTADGPIGVNATLTQLDSKTVLSADPKAVKFLLDPKGSPPDSLRGDWRPSQQIALSDIDGGGDNNGLFELRYDDERYLPFEGTGAVSRWRLEVRRAPADLQDVTVTARYTAEPGGETFATAVKGMLGLRDQWRSHEAWENMTRKQGWKHYNAFDTGDKKFIWRFTSMPSSEGVYIAKGTGVNTIIGAINKHSAKADTSDPKVRTMSFCRNAGAMLGTAASTGGDKKVLNIINKAEYLCRVDLASLAAHGVSAHPALARAITMFETEYVIVPTPGNPRTLLNDLGVVTYQNPFKNRIQINRTVTGSKAKIQIGGTDQFKAASRAPVVTPEKGRDHPGDARQPGRANSQLCRHGRHCGHQTNPAPEDHGTFELR